MLHEKLLGSVKILSVDYDALINKLKEISFFIKEKNSKVIKIMLFGSFARGDYTPESDVDIMIIVKNSEKPFLFRADEFLDYFKEIPFDVNIIVYTKDEIEKMEKDNNIFIKEVLSYAVELG
ncbi:nucleotidyltransferase domain-containing protein [Dictyoglomus turgidum]|uniref:nucleotidyltransferase domain-containing protein n=1 Tax=Dictyoglomus TaxID=13 RepID=UPI000CCEB4F9|nr:nucleotidyltransferase domain-containing protein [Dictyoglomus turgidum]PNV80648.1 MAG: nucleotidyltransferase domain-containing protein [Dictyoglomus turgidum]